MKFSTGIWPTGLIFLIFGVQEAYSLSGAVGFSTFLLAIMSGFLLGTFTLTSFIVFLMAVTPQEGRVLHKRGIRSVEADLAPTLPIGKNESIRNHQSRRIDGRFLQNLIAQDPLNCLPQLLCSAASSPSTKAEDIINDYQFLMKEVLQQASDKADGKESSGYHNIFTKLESYNNDDVEDEEKDSEEKESDEELDKIFGLMALKEKSELEDQMYSELVDEDPDNLGFVMAEMNDKRKRDKLRKGIPTTTKPPWLYDEDFMKVAKDPDLKNLFERFKPRLSRNLDVFTQKLEANKDIQVRNPRMEKLAFFSRKQRELKQAVTTDEKFRIATDVGQKYRSGRQCRRLFNTCPFQPNTLSRLVNNLRRVLTGTPTHNSKQTGSLTNNGQGSNSIVSTATKPSTNVQVVVNLGSELNGLGGKQSVPVTPSPFQIYQPPVPAYQQPPLLHIPISVPNAFSPAPNQIPIPTPAPTVNYQNFMNTFIHPSPTVVPLKTQLLHPQSFLTNYQSQTYTTRRTTQAPAKYTTFRTALPITESDSLITKPFFENFLNLFNLSTTAEPELEFHTSTPININKLPPKKESQKVKPSSSENFGYSFSKPMMHQSSTTTEKGYLLPVGFDVDPGTRTISSALTSTEFVTTTLSEGLQEDGTWMPLEHIFTHPTEGSGSEFVLHRQPPKTTNTSSIQNKGGATFHFQHQSSAERNRIPVTVAPQKTTKSPQRIAAEDFLNKIMNGHHTILPSSTTIFTTTAKPKIISEYTNKPKPSLHIPPEEYLKELEVAFKFAEKPNKKIPQLPTTTEAEQRESDELLSFIQHMEKEKLRGRTEKPSKSNQYVQVTEDPDMKEIDEVIKLLDEQSKEESEEENQHAVSGKRPGKPKKIKTKSNVKASVISPLPTKATTTTTTSTTPRGIASDMNEVINLLNNEEKKPKLSRSQKAKGTKSTNRRNSKITRNKKRKPKPSSEESSEEDYEDNELPPSFIDRYRQIQLRRPLIAVPYRRQRQEQDSEEDDLPSKPPSPVQALTSGVYSFLFNGMNNKNNNVANKPPMERYLPLRHKQHSYRNQLEDEDERPYFRHQYIHQPQRVPEYRREFMPPSGIPGVRKTHTERSAIFQGGRFKYN